MSTYVINTLKDIDLFLKERKSALSALGRLEQLLQLLFNLHLTPCSQCAETIRAAVTVVGTSPGPFRL